MTADPGATETTDQVTQGGEGTISATSTVAEARARMDEANAAVLVVLREGSPIGVVTRAELEGTANRRPRSDARLEDIMTKELVIIDPSADVLDTLNTYTDQAWKSLRRRGPCGDEEMQRRHRAFDLAETPQPNEQPVRRTDMKAQSSLRVVPSH